MSAHKHSLGFPEHAPADKTESIIFFPYRVSVDFLRYMAISTPSIIRCKREKNYRLLRHTAAQSGANPHPPKQNSLQEVFVLPPPPQRKYSQNPCRDVLAMEGQVHQKTPGRHPEIHKKDKGAPYWARSIGTHEALSRQVQWRHPLIIVRAKLALTSMAITAPSTSTFR